MEDRSLKRFINKVSVFLLGRAMLFTLFKLLLVEAKNRVSAKKFTLN